MSEAFGANEGDLNEDSPSLPAIVRDPIGVLRRGWKWGVAAFVLLLIPTLFGAMLVPLSYEAATRLMLTGKAIPDEFVPDSIRATGSEQVQAIENRVLTRSRLSKLVQGPAFEAERAKRTVDEIVEGLRRDLKIEKRVTSDSRGVPSTVEVRLSMEGKEPEPLAKIVNLIADEFVKEHLEYRAQQSQVPLNFMRREFERADTALREHQRELARFRDQNRGSLPEEEAATLAKLERLENERRSIVMELNDARAQFSSAGKAMDSEAGAPSVRERLEAEYERLRAIYTDEHPEVIAMRRRIDALDEGDVISNKGASRSDRRARIEAQIERRRQRLAEIDEEVRSLDVQVSQTSKITEEYRALQRKETILQEAYVEYLRKLQNAELSRSLELSQQGAQLVRLEAATPPVMPVIPRLVFVAAAVVVSLAGGAAVVVLHELLSPVVIDALHLQKLSSLPTLGSIPPVT